MSYALINKYIRLLITVVSFSPTYFRNSIFVVISCGFCSQNDVNDIEFVFKIFSEGNHAARTAPSDIADTNNLGED